MPSRAQSVTPRAPPSWDDHRMESVPRWVHVLEVLRYARDGDASSSMTDGYRNYRQLTAAPGRDDPRLLLEAGINRPAAVPAVGGARRSVIAIRSSPWKAGHDTNPWHDEFDVDHGHIRYYGDHKPSTGGMPGATRGNQVLLEAWRSHASTDTNERLAAPPLMVFRSVPAPGPDGRVLQKGHIEFCGAAIIDRLEHVVQRDPKSGRSFPNLVLDLTVVDLRETGDGLDWRWIDDRRDPSMTAEQSLRHAPASWRSWVQEGRAALPRIRRQVRSSRLRTDHDQRPLPGSNDEQVLNRIYRFFDGRKHSFEHLAARVAAEVLSSSGNSYRQGWLTAAGGDGGLDFVGRLDVGTAPAYTSLVVLGQAKCVDPKSKINAEQIARVVARLQRGWIGVYVTTGVFSRSAQLEILNDRYPLVLISARTLVEVTNRLAQGAHAGDVDELLEDTAKEYAQAVTHRRPEEILSD